MRVRKQSASETTEYIYFGGQPIAERDATNGDWSDYIYAGGRRIARADTYEYRIRINGNNATTGLQSRYTFPNNPQVNGYVIRSGDRIYLRQENYDSTKGGIVLKFTNGTDTRWNTYDQNGIALNNDSSGGSWHPRYVDLSAHAGKTIQDVYLVNDTQSPAGLFRANFTDIAIASTDGAVRPIYNRQKAMTLTVSCDAGVTDCWQIIGHPTGIGWAYHTTTTYYHGDHLGSSRFLSSYNGTPMWEATYLPYGQEWNGPSGGGPVSPNHYKFTGKERDGESGLDYFGARYYASAQGRFLSPDEFTGGPVDAFSASDPLPPGPLPYAEVANPQSLNKYAYALNNPLNYVDPDGHEDAVATVETVKSGTKIITRLIVTESPKAAGGAAAGGAAAGGAVLTGLSFGLVGAAALAAYSSFDLTRAQIEQEALFAEVGEQNRQKLLQQQQQQEKEKEKGKEPSAAGAGSRKGSGRDFSDLIRNFQNNTGQWEMTAVHAEPATGKKARGGSSVQEVYTNKETGETIVRHTLYDKNGKKIDEHFRPLAK
jgi:RHS repeat-associated protein